MNKILNISLILIITFVTGYCTFIKEYNDKIVFEGFGKYNSMSSTEEIREIVNEEKIETLQVTVVGKANFQYDIGLHENLTLEQAEKIQKSRREAGASYFKEFNQKLFDNMPQYNYKNVYVSKYFPQVVLDVASSDVVSRSSTFLNEIAKLDIVDTVYVQQKQSTDEFLYYAFAQMNVEDELNSGSLTGNGIKVGVLDVGIIDEDNTNFDNIYVETRDAWYFVETVSDHATTMASCIGGREGVAKNASIYSVQGAGNPSSELDWLLDKGVHILNCSYGYGTADGVYSSHSATYDYMIWTYGVSVIAASGNESSGETDYLLPNPALAYNAITVGGTSTYDLPWAGSCYNEVTEVDKPTLVNSAREIQTQNATSNGSGTSYSCALTTGCAALLMEYCSDLILYPSKLTAVLCAGTYDIGLPDIQTSGLDNRVGCGSLDFKNSKVAVNNCSSVRSQATDTEGKEMIYREVYVTAGETICVAAAWCGKSNDSVQSWVLNNYTLCLFRPTGAQVEVQYSLYNNVLLIRHTAQQTGNYKIMLLQEGDLVFTDPTYIFTSYYIWPES